MESIDKHQLRQEIMEMPELPTLPSNVIILMDMLRDTRTPAKEAIEQIEQDQVLSARVLKLVNSSYYNEFYGVSSIGHAVAMLGYHEIWKLLIASSAMELISTNDLNMWLHSYTSSILMKELVSSEKIRCSSRIQLTMLMHDIGKVVLLNFNPEVYRKVQDDFALEGVMTHTTEEARFGVNHAEVGAWLLEGWALDEEQTLPISQHHSPEIPTQYATETVLIKLVDYIDHSARGHSCLRPTPAELEHVGLSDIDQDHWLEEHAAKISELGLFDLPHVGPGDD